MKVVQSKVKDVDVISGTEATNQVNSELSEADLKSFQKKWQDHKTNYIKNHSTKDMVYENGSALALLYKEVQRLNDLLTTNLKRNEQN
jgi:hypothetical protein